MAYVRSTVRVEVASLSDYSDAVVHEAQQESSAPTRYVVKAVLPAPVAPGYTLDLAWMTTVGGVMVKNVAAGNVTVAYNAAAGATSQVVPAGEAILLQDVAAANDLVFTGAAGYYVEVTVWGV